MSKTYNIDKAIKEISGIKNAASYIVDNASFKQGDLNGLTYTLKDLIATKDFPTQGSSKILEGFIPHYNATLFEKLNNEGAALVAKVHSDELGLGGTGNYSAYGKIENPLGAERIIGGSSSGSVVTLTENVAFAIGTDTGDSVRLPASYHGHYGFKPSYGAISRYGVYPYASSLDTVGIFAHDINTVIKVAQVLYGQDKNDMTSKIINIPDEKKIKPKRVAILKDNNNVLRKEIRERLDEFVLVLEKDGIKVERVLLDQKLLELIDITYSIISYAEVSSNDSNLNGVAFGKRIEGQGWSDTIIKTRSNNFGKMVARRLTLGSYFLSNENQLDIFQRAQKVRRIIVNEFNKIYDNFDLLIFPSSDIAPLELEGKNKNWHSSYLIAANFNGNPSISVPWIKFNNLPVGLNFDSKIYSDKNLLAHVSYIKGMMGGQNE